MRIQENHYFTCWNVAGIQSQLAVSTRRRCRAGWENRRDVKLLAKQNESVYNTVLKEVKKRSQNPAGHRSTLASCGGVPEWKAESFRSCCTTESCHALEWQLKWTPPIWTYRDSLSKHTKLRVLISTIVILVLKVITISKWKKGYTHYTTLRMVLSVCLLFSHITWDLCQSIRCCMNNFK